MDQPGLFHNLASADGPGTFRIRDAERELGQGEFLHLAGRIAAGLVAAGLAPGDRVVVRLPNRVEVALAAWATSLAGGVFVILSPNLKEEALRYILRDCAPAALVCTADDTLARQVGAQVPGPSRLFLVGTPAAGEPAWADLEACREPLPTPSTRPDDLAALFYTSGSTGFPKGVMLTHRTLLFTNRSIATYLENGPSDHLLVYLPLSFDYGFFQVSTAMLTGARVTLETLFFAARALQRVQESGITGLPLVPAMVAAFFHLRRPEEYPLPTLRYVTNTAQALPIQAIRRFRRTWPHVRLFSMYGLTECTRTLYLPPAEIDDHPGSVGGAIPGTRVRLVRPDGTTPEAGERGELRVQGDHLMQGYWRDPETTAHRLRTGPDGRPELATGDLFSADGEGRLTFHGRMDDLIKVMGRKVYPLEVERHALAFPGVVQACLVGVPDSFQGERLVLHLVVTAGEEISDNRIIRHLASCVEESKVPREIRFHASLPLTGSGKVDRRALIDNAP